MTTPVPQTGVRAIFAADPSTWIAFFYPDTKLFYPTVIYQHHPARKDWQQFSFPLDPLKIVAVVV